MSFKSLAASTQTMLNLPPSTEKYTPYSKDITGTAELTEVLERQGNSRAIGLITV
jgi:hypothetical protein